MRYVLPMLFFAFTVNGSYGTEGERILSSLAGAVCLFLLITWGAMIRDWWYRWNAPTPLERDVQFIAEQMRADRADRADPPPAQPVSETTPGVTRCYRVVDGVLVWTQE